jgi:hypothetical protein
MLFAERLIQRLRVTGRPRCQEIIANEREPELTFARSLGLPDLLEADPGRPVPALFGYPTATPDFRPRGFPGIVIEFKKIGHKDTAGRDRVMSTTSLSDFLKF